MSLPILVVNPNTTKAMTDGLEEALEPILPRPTFFTAPSGIASINNSDDCHASAAAVFPSLLSSSSSDPSQPSLLSQHSAVLIACYSVHPLVRKLAAAEELLQLLGGASSPCRPVLGIFEASILASLAICLAPQDRFGIVTTGAVWEGILSRGVEDFLGAKASTEGGKFAGVETTGLTAIELHSTPQEEVTRRLKEAVKRLIRRTREKGGELRAVCLGCAGMVGFDEAVRAGCIEELGDEAGSRVSIVDGVKAGYVMLEGMVRTGLS
ncbi:hypothetical protein JCM10908_004683 [Rhodotorula pacifica]|uniref:aspartate/glutamate racemase family protein n=1 Tax=Rhodotorula pacifica TaxID=1495444 RepID=UPI003182890F